MERKSNPLLLFYVLLVYVIAQLSWWGYLIIDLNAQLLADSGAYAKKVWMVCGEALVFLTILFSGALIVRRGFKKEVALAKKEKDFLMSTSHELKTPIASIRLSLETMKRTDIGTEHQSKLVQNALSSTDRLIGLIENILIASMIDSNEYKVLREPTNISNLLHTIIDEFAARHETIQFVRLIESNVELLVDQTSFISIPTNLLENAIKYAPEGKEITIGLVQRQNEVILTIKDQGDGIDELELDKIFDKFYRSQDELVRKTKGTGLGLYIVKYLTELNKGSISVLNNSDKGVIFAATFKKEN